MEQLIRNKTIFGYAVYLAVHQNYTRICYSYSELLLSECKSNSKVNTDNCVDCMFNVIKWETTSLTFILLIILENPRIHLIELKEIFNIR